MFFVIFPFFCQPPSALNSAPAALTWLMYYWLEASVSFLGAAVQHRNVCKRWGSAGFTVVRPENCHLRMFYLLKSERKSSPPGNKDGLSGMTGQNVTWLVPNVVFIFFFGWNNSDVIVIYLCICFVFTLRGGWSLPTLDAGGRLLLLLHGWKFWIDNIKTKHRNTLWPNVWGAFSGVYWTRLHTCGHVVCTDQGSTLTLDVQCC